MRLLLSLAFLLPCVTTYAEPVDVRQGSDIGSGYTFGRGDTCTVVTAGHVVGEAGVDVMVTDRTGGKAVGQRVYFNEAYDLALVELPRGSVVACNARWPETQWMNGWQADTSAMFDVVRHYPGGRELLVVLRYAGGSSDSLSLAFADKLRIVASDSGSLARLDGKPVGIVRRVMTDIDRLDVLRFDTIDRLVGERFRGSVIGVPVALTGVTRQGRPNSNWNTFIKAWLTEGAGRRVVDAKDTAALCSIGINVIEWKRARVDNPDYEALKTKLSECNNILTGLLGYKAKSACEQPIREKMRSTKNYLNAHKVMFEATVTPRSRMPLTRLHTAEIIDRTGNVSSGADVEREVLQEAIAPVAMEMFKTSACD